MGPADGSGLTPRGGDLLDTAQVAELLGVTINYVRELTKAGKLPAYQLPDGRRYRYFRDEVLEMVRAGRVAGGRDDAEVVHRTE